MNEPHVHDELSEYLDGLSPRPDAIREHLMACPECARHYNELKSVLQAIRSMPGPAPRPDFLAKVMAQTAQAPRMHQRIRWVWYAPALAAAVLAIIIGINVMRHEAEPVSSTGPTAVVAPDAYRQDEHDLSARVEERLAFAMNADALDAFDGWLGADTEPVEDDWVGALAEADWFPAVSETLDDTEDLDTVLTNLDPMELETLRALLTEEMKTNALI